MKQWPLVLQSSVSMTRVVPAFRKESNLWPATLTSSFAMSWRLVSFLRYILNDKYYPVNLFPTHPPIEHFLDVYENCYHTFIRYRWLWVLAPEVPSTRLPWPTLHSWSKTRPTCSSLVPMSLRWSFYFDSVSILDTVSLLSLGWHRLGIDWNIKIFLSSLSRMRTWHSRNLEERKLTRQYPE